MGEDVKFITGRAGISSMGPTDPKGSSGDNHGLVIIYTSEYAKYNIKDTEYLKKLRVIKSDNAKIHNAHTG